MKLEFKVSKLANQFFFISNLSEWHHSCRKDYNQKWLKQTRPLNNKEEKALKEFKQIIKKYGFNGKINGKSKYLGKIFFTYPEKESWNILRKSVSKKEYLIIKNTFDVFSTRFEKIWNSQNLSKRIKKFKRFLELKNCRELFEKLAYFLGNKSSIKKITIVALTSPLCGESVTAAGGANLNDYYITLEIPELKQNSWEFEYSIGIIAHEIGHILFNQTNKHKIIQKIIKDLEFKTLPKNLFPNINSFEFINEFIIETLVPFGYLSQKYFKKFNPLKFSFSKSNLKILAENFENFKNNNPSPAHRLRKFLIWRFYPFVINQIKSKRKFDEKFIKKIVKFIIQNIK